MYNMTKRILYTFCTIIALLYSNYSYADISVENTSTYLGNGRWNWKIYIIADSFTLNQIDSVEYTLHPTFPNPTVRRYNKEANFALEANGWGTFIVKVRVFYNDNTTQDFEHLLVFEEKLTSSTFEELIPGNWSTEIEPGWWEWGITIKGPPSQLDQIRCVEYTLHESFRNPVRTICTRSNNFELRARGWGTFTIHIKVLFKDGSQLKLEHNLHFG